VMAGMVTRFRKRLDTAEQNWVLCASVVFAPHDHGHLVGVLTLVTGRRAAC
jgi:hypothetical protein